VDAYVIKVFISDMTNEALVHELGHCKPQTTWELLDLATSHTSGEEVIHAIFCKHKGKAQAKPIDEVRTAIRE
jgi:predicted acetyltransferase